MHKQRVYWITMIGITLLLIGCVNKEERGERKVQNVTAELQPVVDGNTEFAWDLYDKLRSESGNLFVSPFSISAALSMTHAGARENTEAQMTKVLHIEGEADSYYSAFGELVRDLSGDKQDRAYQLYIANRLFGLDTGEFEADFLSLLKTEYGAGLEQLPFASDNEGSRQKINQWVAEETREKVVDLLQPGDITPRTVLIITNAIYFKALWATRFNPADTYDGNFTQANGEEVTVPMMSAKTKCSLLRGEQWSLLELDYSDHEVSMVLIVPEGETTLQDLENMLVSDGMDDLLERSHHDEVCVRMPQFEFRYHMDLKETLQAVGMTDAFTAAANFTGIAESLLIDKVIHEAYIKVDEEGTEAAASTAVVMMDVGVTETDYFDVDRSFVFAIRDKLTGTILFLGRVDNPEAE